MSCANSRDRAAQLPRANPESDQFPDRRARFKEALSAAGSATPEFIESRTWSRSVPDLDYFGLRGRAHCRRLALVLGSIDRGLYHLLRSPCILLFISPPETARLLLPAAPSSPPTAYLSKSALFSAVTVPWPLARHSTSRTVGLFPNEYSHIFSQLQVARRRIAGRHL